jgi:hypothetical protein
MKKMFILISHTITQQQKEDAVKYLGIDTFCVLPTKVWSQIPAEHGSVKESLMSLKKILLEKAKRGDYLFVQGDYGATFNMVQFAKESGLVPVYATSIRKAYEVAKGEKVVTVREFQHVRFREY